MTFFSVIIPVYNRSHLLEETIDTVLAQRYPHFEIIIVDDGSTENIKKVLDQNYSNEPGIKYFRKENEERGAARNFGLQQAKGDYAVFFDSDDFMKPHYLETLNKIIADNPGIKLLATKYNYDNNGKAEYHPFLQHLAEGWYDQDLFFKRKYSCLQLLRKNKRPLSQTLSPAKGTGLDGRLVVFTGESCE